MKNIVKTVSLLTIISVIPAAWAATNQRVGVVNYATSRIPSIAGYIKSGTSNVTYNTTAAYYGDADCIEKYEDCLRDEDACGSDFQECTTDVLLHAQMPKCSSVLYQCTASGVDKLFGTSAIRSLSKVASYVKDENNKDTTEVEKYVYPTEDSELNNLIAGARDGNRLTDEQCVRRYTNCLKRDDICGDNFELCTSEKLFRKQAILCDSTLQRCSEKAKKELFGSSVNASALKPGNIDADVDNTPSRLKQLIDEGQALAAKNAVLTCQRVTDNCLINACTKNPLRCVEGVKWVNIYTADIVSGTTTNTTDVASTQDFGTVSLPGVDESGQYVENYLETQTGSDIRKMLKAQCLETIGTNKYCHMTYREKSKVSEKDLMNIDLQEDVFSLAYAARKEAVNTKLQEAVKKFDTDAKNKCVETIKSCAMRSCGGGLGSVCYSQSRLVSSTAALMSPSSSTSRTVPEVHVNGDNTYGDIYAGCAAIVNADANCIYAATSGAGYTYTYYDDDNDAFKKLFPKYTENSTTVRTANNAEAKDPIGAVAKLNALLATSYNDAAIEQMKKQCQTTVLSCVRSMCGKDYINCYRNRTDVVAGSYSTGSSRFDRSMNKMGGVLDYNIIQGLCMNTVKNSSVCEEHLKVATANWRYERDNNSWSGTDSNASASERVREAWLDSASELKVKSYGGAEGDVIVACRPSQGTVSSLPIGSSTIMSISTDKCANAMYDSVEPDNGKCGTYMDETGCVYGEAVYMSESEYVLENGAKTLFQTLLRDEEKQAQNIYNAKLTKEQNICRNNNNGGIMGNTDNGATFMWVKLRGNKVPKDYVNKGLSENQFVGSNDLYGSFCRARVTIMSDDKDIQNFLTEKGGNSVAYFAVGDSFTCGSWLSNKTLQQISEKIGEREVCKQGYGQWENGECKTGVGYESVKEKVAYSWSTIGGALAGMGIGLGLTESGVLSSGVKNSNARKSRASDCSRYAESAISKALTVKNKSSDDNYNASGDLAAAGSSLSSAIAACKDLNKDCDKSYDASDADDIITAAQGIQTLCKSEVEKGLNKGVDATNIAVPITTSVGGLALGVGIAASVIKLKKENIKNEAAQKWMDEIGDHIQCYIGAEELGTYGDVVSIELD